MRNRFTGILFGMVFCFAGGATLAAAPAAPAATAASAPAKPPSAATTTKTLELANKPWTGDFEQMLERRMIRVLVPFSRSLYYVDRGHERGLTAELVRDFERWVNKTYKDRLDERPLTVYLIPTTRDKLISGVASGLGDIAAGNITVTEARDKVVDFAAPADASDVNEIIATGPGAPAIASLDDLAGKTVHARPSTSYYESLLALNTRLVAAGKPRVVIVPLPDALEDEDKLEMLNVGLLQIVVIDDWKGRLWAQTLPKIKLHESLVLRDGGRVGWAHRSNSPQLAAALDQFYTGQVKKQGVIDYRLAQLNKRVKQLRNNAGAEEIKRLEQTIELFRKYGDKYGFDPIMLAAQGYQESQLRQDAKSHVGAIGVMQIMPATGKELAVGNIAQIEPNIHGGTKYMDQLMTRYFKDADFKGNNRSLFAFAAYNAGPGNIAKMRKLAAERGLDPDKWFNNVEIVTAEKIGIETTTYVRNIFKYYTSYKLLLDARAEQRRALEAVQGASAPKR
ncbi:transglycosylase SLT domain-containing protein [Rivibacter subsaxonicus]|uniref:Membrane-bound lytic murein transglycosylase MltF n=1 Tax=Rivibacter subsaxonicus TaxID=457575 RepID=A0A4Q7VVD2_9BURK|nr:transglycosylase SLT domain-containing protein [Rivibacter subsaxonicus]RZU00624.1 membrane-bound lytic murein transglycosylase MltF [Rivibacter subsaxonicus]